MYLLDTNVISELRKAKRGNANPQVVAWLKDMPVSSLFISAITLLELEKGIAAKERVDPVSGAGLRQWLKEQVLKGFDGRILPVNKEVAQRCAYFHVPDPAPVFDSLIAATADQFTMTLVTRNIKDFTRFGIKLFNPWEFH